MKKITVALILILVFSVFSGCGSETSGTTTDTTEAAKVETTTEETLVRIGISKESLADPEGFINSMEGYGAEVKDMTDAGGYLLLFSETEHKKLLADKKAAAVDKLKEYEENPEHYVDCVEYNDDFRNLIIYVDKDKYSATGSTTGNVVVASAVLSYQMFLEEGQRTDVEIIYSGTDEIITTFTLPMNLSLSQ